MSEDTQEKVIPSLSDELRKQFIEFDPGCYTLMLQRIICLYLLDDIFVFKGSLNIFKNKTQEAIRLLKLEISSVKQEVIRLSEIDEWPEGTFETSPVAKEIAALASEQLQNSLVTDAIMKLQRKLQSQTP